MKNKNAIVSKQFGRDMIVCTSLNVKRTFDTGITKWKHDYHHQLIKKCVLKKGKAKITEYGGNSYEVNLDTGKAEKPDFLETLRTNHAINESVVKFEEPGNIVLLVTELKTMAFSKTGKKLWQHDFHQDAIAKASLKQNVVKVTEMNGNTYFLDIKTGVLVES